MNPPLQAVLFDLDGTLLDSASDITDALNRLREEHGRPPLPLTTLRPFISHGAAATVRVCFPEVEETQLDALRQRFLQLYSEQLVVATQLFPGFDSVLLTLEGRGLPWGVVTNKAGFLTEPLLERLKLRKRCACVVSGDTLQYRKPHPGQLLHAAQLIGLEPDRCLYVGDAERDVQAGKAAGMRTLVVRFGYQGTNDCPEDWQPDGIIDHPNEMLAWLDRLQ